jgi:DNA (cytosine-5)-methyltransferase 1
LQSFPEHYKFVQDEADIEFTPVGRLIGNAVPVKLGFAIGLSLIRHLAEQEPVSLQ